MLVNSKSKRYCSSKFSLKIFSHMKMTENTVQYLVKNILGFKCKTSIISAFIIIILYIK